MIKYVFAFVKKGWRCEERLIYNSAYIPDDQNSVERCQAFYALAKECYSAVLADNDSYSVFVTVVKAGDSYNFERARLWRIEGPKDKIHRASYQAPAAPSQEYWKKDDVLDMINIAIQDNEHIGECITADELRSFRDHLEDLRVVRI